ncbi:sugar-binding transcriptional regulator [Raineyella fluvialis]|uniref:MarR family transcriptional regulator n=1 Tax=Raineyella fluvialis TaxID=2662261 RepID=A0A5Q2FFS4_9ACTN|nr:sugar-binding domain-containing protein [Raineyella fluvialis]QGF23146.1 MarR family transcriptional regulator [Raineyella fluvialis]
MSDDSGSSRGQRSSVSSRGRFDPAVLYQAALAYYVDNATQAEIAESLGVSRPTVSRLLSEARAAGIVTIEVREPRFEEDAELAGRLAEALGLRKVYVTPTVGRRDVGAVLAPGVGRALEDAALVAGDGLLISSGVTVYQVVDHPLPQLPGVLVAPTVGGQLEAEGPYQTNEIARRLAMKVNGRPVLLYAPALPSAELYSSLLRDPHIQEVLGLWQTAKAALLGVGAPPLTRTIMPSTFQGNPRWLRSAVGDINARPYDVHGTPIELESNERLIAMRLEELREVPHAIAVAVGRNKIGSIIAAARAGFFNHLVTDTDTAAALEAAAAGR